MAALHNFAAQIVATTHITGATQRGVEAGLPEVVFDPLQVLCSTQRQMKGGHAVYQADLPQTRAKVRPGRRGVHMAGRSVRLRPCSFAAAWYAVSGGVRRRLLFVAAVTGMRPVCEAANGVHGVEASRQRRTSALRKRARAQALLQAWHSKIADKHREERALPASSFGPTLPVLRDAQAPCASREAQLRPAWNSRRRGRKYTLAHHRGAGCGSDSPRSQCLRARIVSGCSKPSSCSQHKR